MQLIILTLIFLFIPLAVYAGKSRETLLSEYHEKQEQNLKSPDKDVLDTIAWLEYERDMWIENGDPNIFDILQNRMCGWLHQAIILYANNDISEDDFKSRLKTKGIELYFNDMKSIGLLSGDLNTRDVDALASRGSQIITALIPKNRDLKIADFESIVERLKPEMRSILKDVHLKHGITKLRSNPDAYSDNLR